MTTQELEELTAQQAAEIEDLKDQVKERDAKIQELNIERDELKDQVAELEAERDARLAALEATEARKAKAPTSCINCGQRRAPIQILVLTEPGGPEYHCPSCGHEWTEADERAPFRQGA